MSRIIELNYNVTASIGPMILARMVVERSHNRELLQRPQVENRYQPTDV